MKNLIYLLGVLFLLLSCDRKDEENTYPNCLNDKIESILQKPVQTPKVSLKKYNYKNTVVYAFFDLKNTDGTDMEVYDENCILICAKGTTIDGNDFDSCIDWEDATYVSTVWTDPR